MNALTELKLVFLGTSSAVPTLTRGLSSLAVVRGGEILLFDLGEGVQRAMIGANLGLNRETKVFITHMHGDHVVGVLGLLQTMAMVGRERQVDIYGPRGIAGFVKQNMRLLHFNLTFPLHVHTVKDGEVLRAREYAVKACKSEHSSLAYSYCLEEFDRPGVFLPEKATSLGVPEGRLWSLLQHGRSVKVGKATIHPSQVMGCKRPGRKIGISGDTRPSETLARFFKAADVLIYDSTYGDEHAEKAVENMHSTAREAAELAKKVRVKVLVLTHFSARYEDSSLLLVQAKEIHSRTFAAYDLMEMNVPYPDQDMAS